MTRKIKHREAALELQAQGLSNAEIAKQLGVAPNNMNRISNPKPLKTSEKELASNFFEFSQVFMLLKEKNTNAEIAQILRPDLDVRYFYDWKLTLPEQERQALNSFKKICNRFKLIDVKVERLFQYKETSEAVVLPKGAA